MGASESKRFKRIKKEVIQRDGFICCYCDKDLTLETLTLDHIVPDSKRGLFNFTNLTVACSHCNNKRGNKYFFDYCKKFNWSQSKLNKYKLLYFSNLKIKVLNIAKEQCLNSDYAVPLDLINQACKILKIKSIDFSDYENNHQLNIKFSELCERKKIKFCFEKLIKIIESDVW